MSSHPATFRVVDPDTDDRLDCVEVPAAVVCARCGSPDCAGCEPLEETTLPSGVISIVPWERPGLTWWARLWSTARAATRAGQQFFQCLPPGDYAAAVRFAVITELLAVSSWVVFAALVIDAAAPALAWTLISDPVAQVLVLRLVVFGVFGFSAVLVLGHVVHGLALEQAALRQGARAHRSQALRYGLYSTGWDILSSPLGLLVTMVVEGPKSALTLLPLAVEVPSQAATGLLRGVFHLESERLERARRFGSALAMVVSIAATACVMLVLAVLAVL